MQCLEIHHNNGISIDQINTEQNINSVQRNRECLSHVWYFCLNDFIGTLLKTSFLSSLKTSSSCSNCSEESDEVDCSVGEDGQVFSKLVDIILDCNQLSSNTAIVNCHQTQHDNKNCTRP